MKAMYGEDRPFYSSPVPLDFGVDSHHSYSSDATEYSVNEMKYNNYPLNDHFYNGSQQSNISDDYQYNDIGRDYFKLPGFHQTFGSTEIARFSQHDEIFEQIQNQLLSSPISSEPAPSSSSPLSSLIDHHNNVLSESHNQTVALHQTLPSAKKPKTKTQRRTKATANKSSKSSSSSNNSSNNSSVANVSYNMPSYNSMEHNQTPTHPMPEPNSKYWNNQMSSYYDRPYIPSSNYPYHHMNHNYSPPDHGTMMCNNYECRYHHTSYPYNSYQNSYYENPYYSSQQYHYSHNYHSNYWGYNCQTV
ncbi:hypothetical protein WDU94_009085 [Cyamophila willieti]